MTEDAQPAAAELTPVQWLGRLMSVAFQPGTVAVLEYLPGQELTHRWWIGGLRYSLDEPTRATSSGWCLRIPGQWTRSTPHRWPRTVQAPEDAVQLLPAEDDTEPEPKTSGSTAEGEMVLHWDRDWSLLRWPDRAEEDTPAGDGFSEPAAPSSEWLPAVVLLVGGTVEVPTALAAAGGLLHVAELLDLAAEDVPPVTLALELRVGPDERAALHAAADRLRAHHEAQPLLGAVVRLTRPLLRQPLPDLQDGAVEVTPGRFYSGPAADFVAGLLGSQQEAAGALLGLIMRQQKTLAQWLQEKDPEAAQHARQLAEASRVLIEQLDALDEAATAGPAQVVLQPAGDPFDLVQPPVQLVDGGLARDTGVPNNPVTATSMEAILAGGPDHERKAKSSGRGWEERGGRYIFRHEVQRGNRVDVQYEPPEWEEEPPENALQVQQDRIARLSLFDADVMLALLVLIADSPERDKAVVVTTDRLLAMKGLQHLKREDRGQKERQLYAAMDTLRCLSYSARVNFRGGREAFQQDGDRLLNIVRCTREEQAQLFAGGWVETDRAWRVRPGQWAGRFLAPSRQEGLRWVARMAQRALELSDSPHRPTADLAKRIYYAHFLVPGSIFHANRALFFTVEKLLASVYLLPPEEERPRNWGKRTRDALEDALNMMVRQRLLGHWSYTDETDEAPVRGWVDRWLKRRLRLVSIEVLAKSQGLNPVPIHPELQEAVTRPNSTTPRAKRRGRKAGQPKRMATRRRRPKEPVSAVPALDAVAVRQKLAVLFWTQRTLARHLGISPSALSQYLGQTRTPSAEVAARVQRWLDTPNEDLGGLPE